MKKNKYTTLVIGCLFGLLSCKKDTVYVAAPQTFTILDIIKINPDLTLFYEAIERSNTSQYLAASGSYTVLAPDNNAFANVGITTSAQIDSLSISYLKNLVLYSIVPKALASADIPAALDTPYPSLLGPSLFFSTGPGFSGGTGFQVNGDGAVTVDTKASNGYIHILYRPLTLPGASVQALLAGNPSYSYFVAALKKFGLYNQLSGTGPYTVLAPNNTAMASNGLTPDSISRLDTVHYKKYLFGVYILNPHRIFVQDFSDAPENGGDNLGAVYVYGAFFSADGILTFGFIPTLSFNVLGPGANGILGPVSSPGNSASTWTVVTQPDLNALNGVVQGISNILIYPNSVQQ